MDDLRFYDDGINNPYLIYYDDAAKHATHVLDIGCGSGFITNLLAYRHPDTQFRALDFSNSIEFARSFADQHGLKNVVYDKIDFHDFTTPKKFDVIISNGVLHHIPAYQKAINHIYHLLKDEGQLVVGLYNSYGKMAKRFFNIRYRNQLLEMDQEQAPFEVSFSHRQVIQLFKHLDLQAIFPSWNGRLVDLRNLFNYHNGGLTIYSFRKAIDA